MCEWVITIDPSDGDDADARVSAGKEMHISAHIATFADQMESI